MRHSLKIFVCLALLLTTVLAGKKEDDKKKEENRKKEEDRKRDENKKKEEEKKNKDSIEDGTVVIKGDKCTIHNCKFDGVICGSQASTSTILKFDNACLLSVFRCQHPGDITETPCPA